jgi:hypothetical protein
VRPTSVRVEWHLYELDAGELHRCPPKDDSYRTIDLPAWLGRLLADHVAAGGADRLRGHIVCDGLVRIFKAEGVEVVAPTGLGPRGRPG